MKIEIDIPDFVPPERIIHIMAGMERIGYVEPHTRRVFTKISRCNHKALCCKKLKCQYLDGNKCGLKDFIPFMCLTSEGRFKECSSRYEVN